MYLTVNICFTRVYVIQEFNTFIDKVDCYNKIYNIVLEQTKGPYAVIFANYTLIKIHS